MNKSDFRIDFLGIGAAKSGTTWVYEMLKQHPDLYLPNERKEINYFNKYIAQDYKTLNWEFNNSYEWYHSFFKNAQLNQVSGEITPSYLNMEDAAEKIHIYNPSIKLFIVLRNPVERAFSEYLYSVQNGVNTFSSFEEAIEGNPNKFLRGSMYYSNLQNYFNLFPAEQVKVMFYDDMLINKENFLKQLYRFLNVNEFIPANIDTTVNKSKQVKYQAVNSFIGRSKLFIHSNKIHSLIPILRKTGIIQLVQKIKKRNVSNKTEKKLISPEFKQKLINYFLEDIDQLEKLTSRDLSAWKI